MGSLQDSLERSGVTRQSVVDLASAPSPRHLRYLDLLGSGKSNELLPDAVVESGGVPLAYVVRRDSLGSSPASTTALARLVRVLACRADARYLAVFGPGEVVVYPIRMDAALPEPVLRDTEAEGYAGFRGLLRGSIDASIEARQRRSRKAQAQWLDSLLFKLLTEAARAIQQAAPQLTIRQVLALVGRALFFRFLVDRRIIGDSDLRSISTVSDLTLVFSTVDALMQTCTWLDRTFNGDLLSLGDGHDDHAKYSELPRLIGDGAQIICRSLTNIQCKAVGGQLPLEWGGIDFKHVPVDVLSQVYENFAHEFIPSLARETSIHFTPRKLAEIVVDGAFSAVRSAVPDRSRVLDPAVGGGVFLVLAFRRLVAEQWRASGKRPGRAQIRRILHKQLTGLDINLDALNVTALSLYLCALELDPHPRPLSDLKFEKLIGSILHLVDETSLDPLRIPADSPHDALLGSLSSEVLEQHRAQYDIVVGNPPWNAFKDSRAEALNCTLRRLLTRSGPSSSPPAAAVVARYGSPDIAFVLAASSWAKPAGAIGFAVHGRFLFQEDAFALRQHVFGRLSVTGIMNFAALRQDEKVWPKNDAQFALMVAINEPPGPLESMYFISPRHEPRLSANGEFRIDPGAAVPVTLHDVCTEPHALKALYKGGRLGLDLLRRLHSEVTLPIGHQVAARGAEFRSGYQRGKEHTRKDDASHLLGLVDVQHDMAFVVALGAATLAEERPRFDLPKVQFARSPEIYRGPLILLRESPRAERHLRGALYSDADVAYRESFIGLSAHGKPEIALLLDLIYLVSYSDLFLYYQLLTSPKFGVERDSSLQKDLLSFPLIREETLSREQSRQVRSVVARLRSREVDWHQLDELVYDLHRLSPADRQLVRDTLEMELPFSGVSLKASSPTDSAVRLQFVQKLTDLIAPFVGRSGAIVRELSARPIDGWVFLEIGSPKQEGESMPREELADLARVVESYWATRMTIRLDGRTIVGLLDHRRYWTLTEARSFALDWLHSGAADKTGRSDPPEVDARVRTA